MREGCVRVNVCRRGHADTFVTSLMYHVHPFYTTRHTVLVSIVHIGAVIDLSLDNFDTFNYCRSGLHSVEKMKIHHDERSVVVKSESEKY